MIYHSCPWSAMMYHAPIQLGSQLQPALWVNGSDQSVQSPGYSWKVQYYTSCIRISELHPKPKTYITSLFAVSIGKLLGKLLIRKMDIITIVDITLNAIASVLCILGNSLIITCIAKFEYLKTRMNFFVLSLAVADLGKFIIILILLFRWNIAM